MPQPVVVRSGGRIERLHGHWELDLPFLLLKFRFTVAPCHEDKKKVLSARRRISYDAVVPDMDQIP